MTLNDRVRVVAPGGDKGKVGLVIGETTQLQNPEDPTKVYTILSVLLDGTSEACWFSASQIQAE